MDCCLTKADFVITLILEDDLVNDRESFVIVYQNICMDRSSEPFLETVDKQIREVNFFHFSIITRKITCSI